MARRVFFSFHYDRDIWRVNQIRNIGEIVGVAAAGFHDASLWEDAKTKGDKAIKALIDNGLANTSVTVVCIGAKSAGRKYIDYEIEQSIARGNGIVALRINHLKDKTGMTDPVGATPQAIVNSQAPVRSYVDHAMLKKWIDEAAD
ncbi:TIR domain-containing protein [uncultured Sphingomonas sp.]|uniref:TIR domain-containing protein n=1 Tax=uncultured Sphingomonas sp. TaxID=158754 RepID=UPI0025E0150F|nr:TIR domain-containing protein [uncultured Sphingomonas sp.]